MGFSPGLRLRFVARRSGIENRHMRRYAGNTDNLGLSRMVELRRRAAGYSPARDGPRAPQKERISIPTSTTLNVPNASTAMSKTRVKLIMVSPNTRQPGSMMRPPRGGVYAVCATHHRRQRRASRQPRQLLRIWGARRRPDLRSRCPDEYPATVQRRH